MPQQKPLLWKKANDPTPFDDQVVMTPSTGASATAPEELSANPYSWRDAAVNDAAAMSGGLQRHVIDPARQRARAQAEKAGGFGKGPVDKRH